MLIVAFQDLVCISFECAVQQTKLTNLFLRTAEGFSVFLGNLSTRKLNIVQCLPLCRMAVSFQ